jgi:branched-chain amino acid transport system ATP-binding protein
MLGIKNVSVSFGKLKALNNVTYQVEAASLNTIIGPNGAGKTTLVNVVSGILHEDSGEIWMEGMKINAFSPSKRAKLGIARTFQIPKPFYNLTGYENIKIGAIFAGENDKKNAEEETERVIKILDLGSIVNKKCKELNTDQLKLIDLGRALVSKPKYMFVDEMGAGLSEHEIIGVSKLIRDIVEREKISIIYIGHVMKLVKELNAPITVFHEGSPIFRGSYTEVVQNKRVVEIYLGDRYAGSN